MRCSISPLGCIQQLETAYREHQWMSGILKCGRDTVIGAYFHGAIVRACTIETKKQPLDKSSVIAIDRVMHIIVYGFSLRQFAGKERFGILSPGFFPCSQGWCHSQQGLHEQRQLLHAAVCVLFRKLWKGCNPAA